MADSSTEAVYIIIPVHNRKTTTLTCLQHLQQQGDLERFQVVVVDDGSTDGTSEVIHLQYPQVHLLQGDGHLWWAGATKLGMEYAYGQGAEYFVWLNDDTLPESGTLQKLLVFCAAHLQTIAASQCYWGGVFTYGGQVRRRLKQIPHYAAPGDISHCDALDGNLVCIPRAVVDDIGYPLSQQIPHYGSDNMYTWLAKQTGYELSLLGDAISQCPRDHQWVSWLISQEPIWQHWQGMLSPKTNTYIVGHWHFCIRYWGIPGVIPFLTPYLRLFVITVLRCFLPRRLLWLLKCQFGGAEKSDLRNTSFRESAARSGIQGSHNATYQDAMAGSPQQRE
ncbi:hypothetical protein XM38_023940 [Halomicronema hongdechloris C2206]|uniref:Glycosyltransferase 2-like domain-containing protein n=1 Tax=Halomicronema hongdechloris C2206 TaxID=1641165 RepID=A0A1Z3HM88_9CYAN|nr:glycosyltransferase family 2 protein [Halomicronema hongdechloris]ASC71442.1 hypothetical protein XM38_023940 [Halomicronema hongdechloris C2206]